MDKVGPVGRRSTQQGTTSSVARRRRRLAAAAWLTLWLAAMGAGAACAGGDDTPLADPQAQAGRQLFRSRGCAGCHGINGQGGTGPSLKGLAGSQVQLEDGSTVTADDAYLEESIRNPGAKIAKGYGNNMAKVNLSDQQVAQLVAYLKTLK